MNNNESIIAYDLLKKLQTGEPVCILDVRDVEKFRSGSLELTDVPVKNIPYVEMTQETPAVEEEVANLPVRTQIVTVCTTGNKAQKAASLLRERGYEAVALEGGLTAWRVASGQSNEQGT